MGTSLAMMNSSHYFDSAAGPFERRRIGVRLAGRQLEVSTAGGIFSPDGVDKGTEVLLREVPDPPASGHLLDIGCGWGPVALTMAMLSPQAQIWAVDVNERARTLCAENAAQLGLDNVQVCAPEQVPSGHLFAAIWSNPPIRIGKPALHQLLQLWLPRLDAGGDAHLVVQKNLGADSLLTWLKSMLAAVGDGFTAERATSSKGFRILRISRGKTG